MPAPKDKSQLTPWLKQHGYKWVLQSAQGKIVSIADAIYAIEQDEASTQAPIGNDPITLTGDILYSDAAWSTGNILGSWHDDDTGEYEIMIDYPAKQEKKDGAVWYTFDNGAVLVQHEHMLKTQKEWEEEHTRQ